eukprot:TRINITY_DN3955_c0_g1_i3.p1 TRINITY_DN3955_c0_g1~~TRINITY_DN3955_c0_g1_i3.p1  ORF type:complete len:318 (+),score=105.08 TRINITY_DN3955_c0_g1_i3:69-1022(+)
MCIRDRSYSGWMLKHSGIGNQWTKRWFVLEGGLLSYFYDRSDKVAKAVIPLSSFSVHDGDVELKRRLCLVLKPIFPGDIEYRLCCESPFSKRTWMGKLGAGSHQGRIKFACVGDEHCGKTKLLDSVFYDNALSDCDLKGSRASVGSHVGYIPAHTIHRKDLLVDSVMGEQVVTVESLESPGRGDFSHVRELLYNGVDAVLAMFSLADKESLVWLERTMSNEVRKRVDGAPVLLVGMKRDLRDQRVVPSIGHAAVGSQGHLLPQQQQQMLVEVSTLEGQEAAERLGAVGYFETDGFDNANHAEILESITQAGLRHRRP